MSKATDQAAQRSGVESATQSVTLTPEMNFGHTYIRTFEGFAYLAVVIDLYSRRVVGWSIQSCQTTEVVLQALLMAVWRRKSMPV